ncbi:hypothetical protein NV226_00860 [Mycoplasma iguanae]|uniref:Integral membrane protein n=1 Tax=Mycoplasma iguanae TaxID=292461 RepID=A0ABY5R8L4_9MOLU|nr:hypothetical protein [Mycoplasma iguanae]UVD81844.1 hypothetical protein NV226_00860 [Mycoplasma iguanae]
MYQQFKTHSPKITFQITFAGIMLGLVLLFTFLNRFLAFYGFLKFDFSIIFITITYIVAGWKPTLLILLLRFFIAPSYNEGYTSLGFLGQGVLLIVSLLYIGSLWISHYLFNFKNKHLTKIVQFTFASLVTIIIINILNIFLINPLFFSIFENRFVNFYMIIDNWETYKTLFFLLPNYFLGSLALYSSFNVILLVITSLTCYAVTEGYEKIHKNGIQL